MAKDNGATKFRLIHLILVLAGLLASGVAAWVWQQADIKAIAKATTTLDTKGCEPAKKHETQLTVIEYRLNSIDSKQTDLATEQKAMRKESEAGFREILKRLPE